MAQAAVIVIYKRSRITRSPIDTSYRIQVRVDTAFTAIAQTTVEAEVAIGKASKSSAKKVADARNKANSHGYQRSINFIKDGPSMWNDGLRSNYQKPNCGRKPHYKDVRGTKVRVKHTHKVALWQLMGEKAANQLLAA